MLKTESPTTPSIAPQKSQSGAVAVIWIDWYAYHIARFLGLARHPLLAGRVFGIEMVGGVGVHAGLKFRDGLPAELPFETLFPSANWREASGWKLAAALWKRLNRVNPALVLVPGYYTLPGIASALWGKWHRRTTVLMTESTEADHVRVGLKETLKSWLLRALFDWAVAGGAPHKRYLERLRFPSHRIAGFYDVVDNDFFRERAQAIRRHYTPDAFDLPSTYFLYVGRLAEEKNLRGLLAEYFSYRRSGGAWPLVLVGDGPERASLEQLAAASEFSADIYFPGLKTTAELPQYYAFAGCFVLPSTREPWGLVVNEAMASGLPAIVSDRCGCAEDLIRHGENGFVFDPQAPEELAACLHSLSGGSPEALSAMGQRSQQIIRGHSPEAWAAEIARIAQV